MRNLLLFIVVMGTLSFTISKEVNRNSEKANIIFSKVSPKFSFLDTKGSTSTIEDYKGKYVYLNLWATWSEPSQAELEYLQKIKSQYKNEIVFINLSLDYLRDIKKWKKIVKDEQLLGIQVIANDTWKSEFIKTYAVAKLPRAILINEEGTIINGFAPKPSQVNLEVLMTELANK